MLGAIQVDKNGAKDMDDSNFEYYIEGTLRKRLARNKKMSMEERDTEFQNVEETVDVKRSGRHRDISDGSGKMNKVGQCLRDELDIVGTSNIPNLSQINQNKLIDDQIPPPNSIFKSKTDAIENVKTFGIKMGIC